MRVAILISQWGLTAILQGRLEALNECMTPPLDAAMYTNLSPLRYLFECVILWRSDIFHHLGYKVDVLGQKVNRRAKYIVRRRVSRVMSSCQNPVGQALNSL